MRGGSQAQLIEGRDGHFYVVKFSNNPQSRRVLINEWIASAVLRFLQIETPETAMIHVSEKFCRDNPEAYFQVATGRLPIELGWHFGSRYPCDPATAVVYDFVPDAQLTQIKNISAFRGVLAFDKWMANADFRQAVFFRETLTNQSPPSEPSRSQQPLIAQMIDNGDVFHGAYWRLNTSPIQALYFRPLVYRDVRCLGDFEPWLHRIVNCPENILAEAASTVPRSWLAGEEEALKGLLARLLRRRSEVPDLIGECRSHQPNLFPQWR
jgi:hypothetical protein